MKKVLMFAALAEAGTGVILAAYPPIVVRLLFGQTIADAGVIMSRLAGLCLFALGVACWSDDGSRRPFYGMLSWSILAMLYLIVVALTGQAGILLWPGVAAHAAIIVLLVRARSKGQKTQAA
jgi:hypothetical protein